ncbi:MAG: SCO family protein [Pseudomonadota bacterium]
MNIPLRPVFVLAAVLALALGSTLARNRHDETSSADRLADTVATVYTAPRSLPSTALRTVQGERPASEIFRGRPSLLFFGFASCPDVCPATLATLARAVEQLPEANRPAVYMVTVDPERDSLDTLTDYVSHFDAGFEGLTGRPDQIREFADALYAAYAKVPLDRDSYTMDHFAGIYFVDAAAQVVAVSTTPHRAEQIAADYRALFPK